MADRKILGIDPGTERPAIAVFVMDENGKIQPDYMDMYRRQSQQLEQMDYTLEAIFTKPAPSDYYEFRVLKECPKTDVGLKHWVARLPHQTPPGFPFRDIPTDLIVTDAPMIHSLRQFGMLHMVHHVPLAREYFSNLCAKGLRPWGRS